MVADLGGSLPGNSSRTSFGPCPKCGGLTSDAGPSDLVVDFPEDLRNIEALLRGELNRREHYCGSYFYTKTRVDVVWSAKRLIARFAPDGSKSRLILANFAVQTTADRGELHDIVAGWINSIGTHYLRERGFLDSGDMAYRPGPREVEPISLLGLALQVERDLSHPTKRAEDLPIVDDRSRTLRFLVCERLYQLIIQSAGSVDRSADVIDACRTQIPVTALSGGLLSDLVDISNEATREAFEYAGQTTLVEVMLPLMACAVGHYLAGRENPCQKEFAFLLVEIWRGRDQAAFEQATVDVALYPGVGEFRRPKHLIR